MIVAGIGCRKGTSAAEVRAALARALDDSGLGPDALTLLATSAAKLGEAGIREAADALGLALKGVEQPALEAAAARVETRSARVQILTGVPSVAEAAALAAAGPLARLICRRVAVGPATCALAEGKAVL